MWRRAVSILAARGATAARAARPLPPRTLRLPAAATSLAAARRLACLGPPPPVYDEDVCAGASKLDNAAEFHAVTGNQGDGGDFEMVVPPKPCCVAVSISSHDCARDGVFFLRWRGFSRAFCSRARAMTPNTDTLTRARLPQFVSWASPACRTFNGAFNALTLQHPGVRFYRVDLEAEESARLALEQGVTVRHALRYALRHALRRHALRCDDALALLRFC
jgi:hypothetical protein